MCPMGTLDLPRAENQCSDAGADCEHGQLQAEERL